MIKQQKEDFLKRVGVDSRDYAMRNSIQAALQRNPTYVQNVHSTDRKHFRDAFKAAILAKAALYRDGMTESEHIAIIEEISKTLSQHYGDILQKNRLRIGTTQKAVNLYLKFLWCLEPDWETPPHCPVDRIVLRAAGIVGTWTQLSSIEQYKHWITRLQGFAEEKDFSCLAEWELNLWNAQGITKPLSYSRGRG